MRRLLTSLLLIWGLASGSAAAQEPLQGDMRLTAGSDGPVWVGQRLELYLDIWSDGFSFGDQGFLLPEVPGGFLMQADSSTLKLNENRGGTAWQGLRYTLLLFPQRAGRLEVPPFEVRFSARAGFGTEPAAFVFRTEPLPVEARLPPGADAGGLIVTSSEFRVDARWTPQPPGDGPLELKVGDALTLELSRSARDVPGMVFAPLPRFDIDGLAAYPDAPEVDDRINRGDLTGSRRDSVTFVCEREGRFELPPLRFQWWDPQRETLQTREFESVALQVSVNPAYGQEASPTTAVGKISWYRAFWAVLGVLVAGLLIRFPGWRLVQRLQEAWRARQARIESGEPWAFRQALKACGAGNPSEADAAIGRWLNRTGQPTASLTQWAARSGNPDLLSEAIALQEALVSKPGHAWNGRKLAEQLVLQRKRSSRRSREQPALRPLNPG